MISDTQIIEACTSSKSMSEACAKTGLHFNTFRAKAEELGVYLPNKSGAGIQKKKKVGEGSFSLENIFAGKHPGYQSNKLRIRLLNEKIKPRECEKCKRVEWNDLPIPLELNHIDGNKQNHALKNLEIICPNCHAQTTTYRGKNSPKHANRLGFIVQQDRTSVS